jgi:hypothetical protein
VRYYSPLPNWDYWNVVQHLEAYQAFDISVLWQQHNEHRIVFPEIVFALDMLLVHGRQVLTLAISFMCYFSTWLVMSWAVFSDKSLSPTIRYTAIFLSGIVVGWHGSAAALGIPFLLQWTLTQFASVLAFALIITLRKTSRTIYLIGTLTCATVATYSSANGLLLWPLILAAGLLLSLSRRYMLTLLIAGIVNIGLYFVGFHLSRGLNLSELLSHPFYLIGFLSSYASMPFGALRTAEFGVIVGLVNIVLFLALLAIAARIRLLASAPAIVLFGYFAFTLLSALLTAAGRMNPQDMTFTAAKASRYLTTPLMNWGALIIALIWVSQRYRWRVALSGSITLAIVALVLLLFPKLRVWVQGNDMIFARQQWAALSVENGLLDPVLIRYVFPDLNFVRLYLPQLRSNHLSIFFHGYGGSLGQPLTSRFSGPPMQRQPGAVTRTLLVSGGVEVLGWADGPRFRRVILVNETGRIVGLGEKLLVGFPPDLESQDTPRSLAWVGFINSSFASKSFSAYAIDHNRKGIVPIAGPSAIPATTAAPVENVGAPIIGLEWRMDPNWSVNGVPLNSQFGTTPPKRFYGSWSGSDRNTGQLRSSKFDAPVNGCIVLPVLHGPSVGGLSVEIRDLDTNGVLAVAPMQDADTEWRFWRFPLAPSVKHLRITAEDRGRDSGQWLAVGQPSQCQ